MLKQIYFNIIYPIIQLQKIFKIVLWLYEMFVYICLSPACHPCV